jgi:hypothetical protein
MSTTKMAMQAIVKFEMMKLSLSLFTVKQYIISIQTPTRLHTEVAGFED